METGEQTREQPAVLPLERRKEPRRKVLIHAFVSDPGNAVELKCMIRDISRSGCRIASSYIEDLPRIVHIMPEGFDRPLTGRIVWRKDKMAGIQFLSAAEQTVFDATRTSRPPEPRPAGFFSRLQALVGLRRSAGIARRGEHRPGAGLSELHMRVLYGLRHPLAALKGLLNLLSGDAMRPLPRRARSVIRAAHRNADKANRLLAEALQAQEQESGRARGRPPGSSRRK